MTTSSRATALRLLPLLLLALLPLAARLDPAPASAAGGGCVVSLAQRLARQQLTLGETVEVQIDLDPGCGGEILPRHWVLVLQPWADEAAAGEVRRAVDGFLTGGDFGAGRVGLVMGQPDPGAATPTPPPPPLPTAVPSDLPGVVALTADIQQLRLALSRFGAASPGLAAHGLVRKARDLYLDLERDAPEAYGRRHLVVIGHAAAPLGRESTLRFEAEAAREGAIDLRWYCIGGGCTPVEGFRMIDVADAAAVAADLSATRDQPAALSIDHARLRADFGARADYAFDSARPPADRMGRIDQSYIGWDLVDRRQPGTFRYALRPYATGESVFLSGWVEVEGVTNAGMPVFEAFSAPLRVTVDPRPEQPSACQVRAEAEAGPDPVALDATSWVTLSLVADCPAQRKPVDVVLALDRSGSMRTGTRLDDAKAAARAFVEEVDLDLARVAVMALGTEAELLADLGQDRQALLTGIERLTADGENDFGVGLSRAREILRARRPEALPVVVLLTDGDTVFPKPPGVVEDPWLQAAYWAHLEGIRLVIVCITDAGTCQPKFQQLARPSHYYRNLPDAEELRRFYVELARSLGRADLERLTVTHLSHPAFGYDGRPAGHDAPAREGDRLIWQQADPLFGRSQLRYPLWAWGVGRWPVARAIELTWRDRDAGIGQVALSLPELEVRPPEPSGPCRLDRVDLRADPARLRVEELLTASTRLSLTCDPSDQPVELVLALDHSHSMRGERIERARAAVESLLATPGSDHVRFGLVAFSDTILAEEPLTDDRQGLIERLRRLRPDGETNIGQALNRARLLLGDARPGSHRVVLLLTDGRNTFGSESVVSAADALVDLADLVAVCIGGNCDPVLAQVVSRPAYYFDLPDDPGLAAFFAQLGGAAIGRVPTEIELLDQPHAMLRLQPDSARPPPLFGPNPQYWRFGFPPSAGITVTQELQALAAGRLPRTLWQMVQYRTLDGAAGSLYLPPVAVEVVDDGLGLPTAPPLPSPSATPSATPDWTPTPTPTPTPRRIWLPWLAQSAARGALATPAPAPSPTATRAASPTPVRATAVAPATARPSSTATLGPPSPSPPALTSSPTPVPSPTPEPGVVIRSLSCAGSVERLVLRNTAGIAHSVTGWELRSVDGGELLRLPSRRLDAGRSLTVYSGPAAEEPQPPHILWASREIWQDADDRAELRDRDGLLRSERACRSPQGTATRAPSPSPTATLTPVPRPTRAPRTALPPLEVHALDCRGEVEAAVIRNPGPEAVALVGWRLQSASGGEGYALPARWLAPAGRLTLLSGPEAESDISRDPDTLLWTLDEVWDDEGDEARLLDRSGATVSSMSCPRRVDVDGLDCGGPYEELRLINVSGRSLELGGWYVHASRGDRWFRFPDYALDAAKVVAIGSGPQAMSTSSGDRYFLWTHEAVWHDLGDTAELFDREGRLVLRALCR